MNRSIGILLLCLLSACQSRNELPISRPRDPWVIRSVLDQKPRMISLALHDQGYVAYDAARCMPYKIWKGGIHLNGAAYNNIKTVQPTSWGKHYWQSSDEVSLWSAKMRDQSIPIKPVFKGYIIENEQIRFQYELQLPHGQKVKITEQPEFLLNEARAAVFNQRFVLGPVPAGMQIFYNDQPLKGNHTTLISWKWPALPPVVPPGVNVSASGVQYWLDRSGCNTCHEMEQPTVGPAYRQIAARYKRDEITVRTLSEKVKSGGSGVWGEVAMSPHPQLNEADIQRMVSYILSLKSQDPAPVARPQKPVAGTIPPVSKTPGFGIPLSSLHPGLTLSTIRPAWFRPRVGGMDFHPDGRLLVATWDSLGAVYALRGVETGDTNQIRIQPIATGLHEPLGLKVVHGEIFVMQKNELTQLIDHDGDGQIDEYRAICNSFGVTADFHEYSYGLAYKDNHFYASLGLAMRLMEHELQHPDRGTVIKIDRNGDFEKIATGLRQCNGIGLGIDGQLFVTENQGRWVPACKLIHVQPGKFYGCRKESGNRFDGLRETPPAVWLPQDEIGNSPGQPTVIPHGPYRGQMLHSEVTHGGLKRVFLEKVNGQYQGCVFRFTQGLEAGINRLAWGPDGALYVGGVGMNGNWAWNDRQYGLQRLQWNDQITFELLAVRALSDGFELEFTLPLKDGMGINPENYTIWQWRYEATPQYGGPKLDLHQLIVRRIHRSNDRKKVYLSIPGLKAGYVIYFLLSEDLRSSDSQRLWTGETWYTLNQIPE